MAYRSGRWTSFNLIFVVIALASTISLFSYPRVASADFIFDPKTGKFYKVDGQIEKSAQDQFNLGKKFIDEKKPSDAIKAFKNLAKFFPSDPLVPESLKMLAKMYEDQGSYFDAFKTYQKLLTDFPQSKDFDEIVHKEFDLGTALLNATAKKGAFGISFSSPQQQAVQVFEQIVKNAPYGSLGDQSQFNVGMANKKIGKFQEAQDAFQAVLDNYPSSTLRDQASYQLADVSFLVAKYRSQDGVVVKEAREKISTFSKEFPDSELAHEAEQLRKQLDEDNASKSYEIAQFYEHDGFFESAAIYYGDVLENFPGTTWAKKAQRRLDAIHTPKSYFNEAKSRIEKERQDISQEITQIKTQKEEDVKAGRTKEIGVLDSRIHDLQIQDKSLEKESTQLGKEKKNLVTRLYASVKRGQDEVKENQKELDARTKKYSKVSNDEAAVSLAAQSERLKVEKQQALEQEKEFHRVETELGVSYRPLGLPKLPALGALPTPGAGVILAPLSSFGQMFQSEQVRLVQITEEQQKLRDQRTQLYENRKAIIEELNALDQNQEALEKNKEGFFEEINSKSENLKNMEHDLQIQRDELGVLETTLAQKKRLLESRKGSGGLASIPQGAASATLEVVSGLNFLAKKEAKTSTEKKLDQANVESDVQVADLTREVKQLETELARRQRALKDTQNALNRERDKVNQKEVVQQYSKKYNTSDSAYLKARTQLEKKLANENQKILVFLSREENLVHAEAEIYTTAEKRVADQVKQQEKKKNSQAVSDLQEQKQETDNLLERATDKGAQVRVERTLLIPVPVIKTQNNPSFGFFQPSPAERVVQSKLKSATVQKPVVTLASVEAQRNYLLSQWVEVDEGARRDLDRQISDIDHKLLPMIDREINVAKKKEKGAKTQLTRLQKAKEQDADKIKDVSSELTAAQESENKLTLLKKDILSQQKLRHEELKAKKQTSSTPTQKNSSQALEFKKKQREQLEAEYEKLKASKQSLYDKLTRLQNETEPTATEVDKNENSVSELESKLSDLQSQLNQSQKQLNALQGGVLEQSMKAVDGLVRPMGNIFPARNVPTEQVKNRLRKELEQLSSDAEKSKANVLSLSDRLKEFPAQPFSAEDIAKLKASESRLQEQIISLKALAVERHHQLGQNGQSGEKSISEIEALVNSVSNHEAHLTQVQQKLAQASHSGSSKEQEKLQQQLDTQKKSLNHLLSEVQVKQQQLNNISETPTRSAESSSKNRDEQLITQLQAQIKVLNSEIQETKKQLREEKRKIQKSQGANNVKVKISSNKNLQHTVSKSLLQVLEKEKSLIQEQAKLYQDWLNRLNRETGVSNINAQQESTSQIIDQKLRLENFLQERLPYMMASLKEEENRIRKVQ